MQQSRDEFYYVTVANENYAQPSLSPESATQVIRGKSLGLTFPLEGVLERN